MNDDQTGNPHDEALVAELRAVIERVDPVPPVVTEAAKAVLGWRRLDADLAELLADSALEAELAGARGTAHARSVTFASSDLEIDVEIHHDGERVRLTGQIAPPTAATVEVQAGDGTVAATAEADALGRFRIELDRVDRARLRVSRQGGGAPLVETSWLSF